jgi:hypothetical protein
MSPTPSYSSGVRPFTPTAHPLKELAASLTRDSESLTATTTLMDDLASDARSLDLAASRLLKKVGGGAQLLLVVDQFEELFTACKDEAERQAFVDNVLRAVAPETAGPTLVVLTLRADFFLRLTELGEGTQDTRRRASLDELITDVRLQPLVESVLKVLADARLITTGERAAEVAHEALIREWPALRGWLDENREGLRLHRHLTGAAGAWATKLNRDPGELYRGARLTQAVEWAKSNDEQLNLLEREFLAASKDLAEREAAEREAQKQRELEAAKRVAEAAQKLAETERQAAVRMRVRNRVIMGVGAVAIALAIVALVFGARANQNAALAERQAQIAFAGKLAAQGQAIYEDNPLLGLRLALESLAFAPPDNEATRGSTADTIRKLIAPGRVLKLGNDVEALYLNLDSTLFIIAYATKPGELRRTADGSLVQTLSGTDSGIGLNGLGRATSIQSVPAEGGIIR